MDDVLERYCLEENALRVYIVDDVREDAEKLAESFEVAGAITEIDASLTQIGERVKAYEAGEPVPDVIVIDQHWKIGNTSLAVIGRHDIKIGPRQSVGAALGMFFRSVDSLDDSILMMTSINEEEVRVSPVELAPALAVHKSKIRGLPDAIHRGDEPSSALADLGIDREGVSRTRRTAKWLRYVAAEFGLRDEDVPRLAGAKRGTINSDVAFRQFLWTSRDAHSRSKELQTILVLLRRAYGDHLPTLEQMSAELSLPLDDVLLNGEQEQLLRLRIVFEARAGGPLA